MSTVYFPADHSPAEWLAMARQGHRTAADSFRESDTDGCMTQAANTLMARLYELCAEVAEAGGVSTFTGLTDLDGKLLDARYVETRFGYAWAISNEDGSTSWFNESKARKGERRRAAHEAKGYRLVECKVEAVVMMGGGGSGMAGMFSCSPITAPRKGAEWTVIGEIDYTDE